ncbi:MAG: hypothetical protein LBB08_00125 [Rickettsiales bacterium]|nr:hypothetical protein [Rickettsiales bacterium]
MAKDWELLSIAERNAFAKWTKSPTGRWAARKGIGIAGFGRLMPGCEADDLKHGFMVEIMRVD